MEVPFRKTHNVKGTVILLLLASILLIVTYLHYSSFLYNYYSTTVDVARLQNVNNSTTDIDPLQNVTNSTTDIAPLQNVNNSTKDIDPLQNVTNSTTDIATDIEDVNESIADEECDIFTGEWIPNPDAPYYTNTTCWAIHEHQNCMKYGRPDTGFLKWKWKPDGCELPVFDPYKFLEMVRNKSMAFVGDSVGRNQMQSMICLLSRVEYPIDVSRSPDDINVRLNYVNYNFTIRSFWSPFLVRSDERSTQGPSGTGIFNLYLDEPDQSWTTEIDDFNFVILNAGHWYSRSSVYYQNQQITGCRFCELPNITDLPMTYGYRRSFQTALKAINGRNNFKGIVFLRSFAPSHFENGTWNGGGNCLREKPFGSNETSMEGVDLDFYRIQNEEFKVAEEENEGEKRFRFLDMTKPMLLRPDGHPSRYGHWANANVTLYNDCVHWCLPGPIDTWADFLMHMLKSEDY